MTTIQIRTDEKVKKKAQSIFHGLGIDMSSGINAYLQQVVIRKGIPFAMLTKNGYTPEYEQEILQASREAEAGVNVTKSMTPKEALLHLKSLRMKS